MKTADILTISTGSTNVVGQQGIEPDSVTVSIVGDSFIGRIYSKVQEMTIT